MNRKGRKKYVGSEMRGDGVFDRIMFPRQPKTPLSVRRERNTRRRLKFWKTYHDELHIEEKGLL